MTSYIRLIGLNVILIFAVFTLSACVEAKNTHQFTGNVEGLGVELAFENTGKIVTLNLDEGSIVKAGDIIAVLDHEALNLKKEALILQVEKLENQRALLLNRLSDQEVMALDSDAKVAESELASLRKDYTVQKSKSEDYKVLFESGGISSDQYDDAIQRERKLKDQISSAQASLSSLKSRISDKLQGPKAEELTAIDIDLKIVAVQIQELELTIEKMSLVSPIEGIVEVKYVETGEYIGPGSPIVRIVDPSVLEITLYVPETELSRITRGQKIGFVDSFLTTAVKGEIIYISPVAEFTPKNVESTESKHALVYRIVLKITDPSAQIKPGMFLTAVIGAENE